MIVDTHIHLDDARYSDDIDAVLAHAVKKDVKQYIIAGADPKNLKRAQALAHKYDAVYFAAGVHPYDSAHYDEDYLLEFTDDAKCIAVGECGLDYFRLPEDETLKSEEIARQKEVFVAHIALAKRLNMPLIVHIRDASRDALQLLIEHEAHTVGGVLHCYNADEELLKLADHGFYFGIGGVLTFKNAKKLVNILPKIPLDAIVLETDGPYLTPHPHRGERNEPAYTALVAQKVSELLDISYDEVKRITTTNAHTLFNSMQLQK